MSFARQQTHYELLGLSFLATQDDIRVAYKRLALLWHPDRHPHCDRKATLDKFQAIQAAYSVLGRPERRQAYHLECLDCWDMKEYLNNFKDLLLTPSGLGLQPYSADRMLAGIKHPVLLIMAA